MYKDYNFSNCVLILGVFMMMVILLITGTFIPWYVYIVFAGALVIGVASWISLDNKVNDEHKALSTREREARLARVKLKNKLLEQQYMRNKHRK